MQVGKYLLIIQSMRGEKTKVNNNLKMIQSYTETLEIFVSFENLSGNLKSLVSNRRK